MSNPEAEKRKAAAGTHAYTATIDSIEPDIAMIDAGAFYASAAISLKRIADVAELFAISLIKDNRQKDQDMRDLAHRHGLSDLWDKANETMSSEIRDDE